MPLRKRSSPEGANGREDWLAAGEHGRGRPWAYEQLLFGSPEDRERARELETVFEELEAERSELSRLHDDLDAHLMRIAQLDRRVDELTGAGERPKPHPAKRPMLPRTRGGGGGKGPDTSLDRRSYLLARCEGFDVESPAGPVGSVEGLRFVSRIDRPDLLEVRGGRFGRQLLLVPIEQVDDVRLADRCVVLRSTPTLTSDLLDDLGDRLRRALHHFDHAAS
jgi:hypothetical protein